MNKKMILNIELLMIFFIIINCNQQVIAHSPSKIDLEYDFDDQKLTSIITHNTPDKNSHYIYKIKVYRNDIIVNDNEYTSQPTGNTFELSFNVSAEVGDVLKVWAECNIGGTNEKSITITGENGSTTEDNGSSTPGFEMLILIIGVMFLFIYRKGKRSKN